MISKRILEFKTYIWDSICMCDANDMHKDYYISYVYYVLLGLQTTWLSSSIYWYNKKKHFLSLLLDKIIYFMIHLCHIHKPNKFPVWSNILGKRFWNKLKEKVRQFKHQTAFKVFLTFYFIIFVHLEKELLYLKNKTR